LSDPEQNVKEGKRDRKGSEKEQGKTDNTEEKNRQERKQLQLKSAYDSMMRQSETQ